MYQVLLYSVLLQNKSNLSIFLIDKMAVCCAKFDRVSSLEAGFQQVPFSEISMV